jgi:hypothetical protein
MRNFSNRINPAMEKFMAATKLSDDRKSISVYNEILLKPHEYLNEVHYPFAGSFFKVMNHWMKLPENKFKLAEEIATLTVSNWFL